jgi:hypothetical protein
MDSVKTMETYIQVSMWLGVVAVALRLFLLGIGHYPYMQEHTTGSAVFNIIISTAFIVWAWTLLH